MFKMLGKRWLAGSVAAALLFHNSLIGTAAVSEHSDFPDCAVITMQEQNGYLVQSVIDRDGNVIEPEDIPAVRLGESALAQAVSLPEAYDLRSTENGSYVTPVKNQGGEGLCWAFAALSACESNILRQGLAYSDIWNSDGILDLSEAHMGWFPYTEQSTWTDGRYGDWIDLKGKGGGGGNATIAAYALGSGIGAQLEPYAPYDQWKSGYSEYQRYASAFRLQESNMLPTVEGAQPEAHRTIMKTWLMENGGIYASYYGGGILSDDFAYYQTTKTSSDAATHAISIVGWDDNYDRSHFRPSCMPEENGAWLCKNSWGEDVMDNGYFWMSYEEPTLGEVTQYQMKPTSAAETIYQYDGMGSLISYGADAVANVFTAQENGSLTEISFYNSEANSSTVWYKAQVYLLDNTVAGPVQGKPAAETQGTVSYYGMKTISLPKSVTLRQGQRFSVVIQLKEGGSTGDNAYSFIEENVSESIGLTEYCSAAPGQSFVKNWDQDGWEDTSKLSGLYGQLGNVVLKAVVEAESSAELCSTVQLEQAITLADTCLDPSQPAYLTARTVLAGAQDGAVTQQDVNLAALNLLAALDDAGNLVYPEHLYDNIETYQLGDCDLDGTVSLYDATYALTWYAQSAVREPCVITGKQFRAADVDEDGEIGLRDATLILTYYAEQAVGNDVTFDELLHPE